MAAFTQDSGFKTVNDPKLLIGQINEANQGLNTLQCDFDQEKELSFLEDKVFSSGKFYFQKKDKIRWEYEKPYSYIIIMNGSVIRIQDGEKTNRQDASSSRLFSSINVVMTGIIDGSAISNEEYFISTFFESGAQVKVDLVPAISGMKEFISSIEIYLDKSDYGVAALKIIEKSGDYTLIMFKNKKLNATLPVSVFSVD
jgi:outer membrane lipoprotein-sorting protein